MGFLSRCKDERLGLTGMQDEVVLQRPTNSLPITAASRATWWLPLGIAVGLTGVKVLSMRCLPVVALPLPCASGIAVGTFRSPAGVR